MQSLKHLVPVRAPQTHYQGTPYDHSTLGAPQSYPPPGHPNAGAPQAYHPTARAPQLYPTPCSSNAQANTGASPQEYHPHPSHTHKNNIHVPGTGAPQVYPTSLAPSSLNASQDYTPPPSAISAADKSLPPPKETSFPSTYSPGVSNNISSQQTTPTIYNLPVVNTPLSPPSHSIEYAAKSSSHPSLGSSHTTPAAISTPHVHHQTPGQQHTPVQQQQHVPVQQQYPPVQQQHTPVQQQHTPVQQQHTPVQQQHTPVQQQYTPVQQQHSLVQLQHSPVQQQYSPVQQQHTPVQQQQHLPPQQQHLPPQQQQAYVQQQPPTNTNFYTANVNANANARPVRQSTIYNPQPYSSTPQTLQYPNHTNSHPPPLLSTYTPTTPYGTAPQLVPATPAQHYPHRPAPQPAPAQPMFYPIQQPAAAPPSFHPSSLARVCCITFNEHNKIRLIGANPETVPPLRHAIVSCGAGLEEDAPIKGDGHEFRLSTRPWHTKGKESTLSRLLLLAILKAMAHCRWNVVQAARISKMDSDRDFLMFDSVDPGLGAIEMAEVNMFVMTLMGKDKIHVIGAGPSTTAVVGAIKQAVLTHWKHPIKKDVIQEAYHEFQLEGNPWAPHKAEEAAAKICMAQLLANVGALGYKLYVSLDIHKSSKDSESECLVFRRVGRVWR